MKVLPLGVNSNFRFWGDGITPYLKKAKGSRIWDMDGNEYIDYRLAFGPIILGHSYDAVDEAVAAEIKKGVLAAMTTELEVEVAEMIVDMCPAVEMVRMACSGTEATSHAIRVARAFTGRDLLVKFEGNYHGFLDYTLFSTYAPVEAYGNQRHPIPIPASSGIPRALHQQIITLPFNDFEGLERVMQAHGNQVAAVITEPIQGNCGAILPKPGFLELIRQKTTEYGALFILDEVKTGFRLANGGAQEVFNVVPDLATYAKAMGNGYPVACFGGSRDVMRHIGHGVSHGGTYTNNKPGIAAAKATLSILRNQPIIETINRRGTRLIEGLKQIFQENNVPVVFNGLPSMFSFAIAPEPVADQRQWAKTTNRELYLSFAEAALEMGVMCDFDAREPWFLSYSHTDKDIDRTLEVYSQAVKSIKVQ